METYMFLFKLLVIYLYISLPLYSKRGCFVVLAASGPVPSPSPGVLPPKEVYAVNALLRRVNIQSRLSLSTATVNACDNGSFNNLIMCHCSILKSTNTCHVTTLWFGNEGLEGHIPEEIGDLRYLTELSLSRNKLRGPIPKSLANLTMLEGLSLYENQLEGPIPAFLGNMTSLTAIDLSENRLSGLIPSQLSELPSLTYLDLSENRLSGLIPSQLSELPSLTYLSLGYNLLSGKIPKALGNISSLQGLYLGGNELEGQLPDELGDLTNLTELGLGNNRFNGTLPSRLKMLQNLVYFYIQGSGLSGNFTDFMLISPQLDQMILAGNYIQGPFPDVFPAYESLLQLEVNDLLGGGEKGFMFPYLTRFTNLTRLTLRNCSLTGRIPDFIWKLSTLNYLDLSFNSFTGGIPPSYNGKQANIFLRSNKLNQSLPRWLTQMSKDSYVDVSENLFTNTSLPTVNKFQNLNLFASCSIILNINESWQQADFHCFDENLKIDKLYINCGGDKVSSHGMYDYEADLEPKGGSTFFLSKNKYWAYSSMAMDYQRQFIINKTCNLSMVDAPLYQTARTASISLKYYGFCLRKNDYTVKLHFAEIAWEQDQLLEGLRSTRIFDVEIQGNKVESDFNIEAVARGVNLEVTREYNVTVNDSRLEIHLFSSGKGSYGIGPLISAISISPVPKKHKKLSSATIAGLGASSLLFVILILVLFWKLGWFGGKKREERELFPGGMFNFHQIKAATNNFSAANKLGRGGFGPVYKGVLPNGTAIAVKQLSTRSGQGIREFVNEIGTISALRHPNLVRLMGCCVEDNQLLIVYEYMQNNSLGHAFFDSQDLRSRLDWGTRVKLCLDIAKGLVFLHEESIVKIIHRDIKPSNILLDEDLNAKISDFGFARLFEEDKDHVITRIQGTTGYMAPEYAMRGYLTTKADVYSFGIVLLEIISGQNAATYRSNDQSVFLLDKACVLQKQGNLLQLIDKDLGDKYSWKEASTILELAMLCVDQSYMLRPHMSDVVKVLQGKRKIKDICTDGGSGPQAEASSPALSLSSTPEVELSSSVYYSTQTSKDPGEQPRNESISSAGDLAMSDRQTR